MAAVIDTYANQAALPAVPTNATLAIVLNDAAQRGGTGTRGLFIFITGIGWLPAAQSVSTAYSPT